MKPLPHQRIQYADACNVDQALSDCSEQQYQARSADELAKAQAANTLNEAAPSYSIDGCEADNHSKALTQPAAALGSVLLDDLINKHVWRSGRESPRKAASTRCIDTGYEALNTLLSQGGWPVGATTEIGLAHPGIGELRLLIPALAQCLNTAQSSGYAAMIAPPHQLFAPALIKYGLDLSRIIIVRANKVHDILWAAEQALLSEACSAVFTWTGPHALSHRAIRRLQLAAKKNQCWHVLLRHSEQLEQGSTSSLRVQLSNDHYSRLKLHIVKQPQSWGGQECVLSLPPHYEQWQRLRARQLPHSNRGYMPTIRHVRVVAKATPHHAQVVSHNNVVRLQRVS